PLAIHGPNSLRVLQELVDIPLGELTFFRLTSAILATVPLLVSRTGYTGDLGYELWFSSEHAERIWDVLMEKGRGLGIKPSGMLALDIARLEAGFILLEVDYIRGGKGRIEHTTYSSC